MISSLEPWRTKEQLEDIVKRRPSAVHITGMTLENQRYDGYVNKIPYKTVIVVKHHGKHFYFSKETNGTFSVK